MVSKCPICQKIHIYWKSKRWWYFEPMVYSTSNITHQLHDMRKEGKIVFENISVASTERHYMVILNHHITMPIRIKHMHEATLKSYSLLRILSYYTTCISKRWNSVVEHHIDTRVSYTCKACITCFRYHSALSGPAYTEHVLELKIARRAWSTTKLYRVLSTIYIS